MARKLRLVYAFLVISLFALGLAGRAQEPPAPLAHFHHLHLNSTDPAKAIEFYTSKFASEQAKFAGRIDAVWTQKSWLLFDKVKSPPPWELSSAIWHFGWGAEDMPATYQKQLALGTKFFTPLTHVPEFGPNFYYAYAESPDRALIELNSANHHHFGHLHLFSADPVTAGEWYMKHFGARRRGSAPPSREPRFLRGFQIGPSMSLMMDNVNLIIFPLEYAKQAYPEHWQKQAALVSTKGRVVDHVAFSVDNLMAARERLTQAGVKLLTEPRVISGTPVKSFFLEGPDQILLEVVEGHARKE